MKKGENAYVVIREIQGSRTAVLGSFRDLVEADDRKDEWAAKWFDQTKGLPAEFSVVITTYYK